MRQSWILCLCCLAQAFGVQTDVDASGKRSNAERMYQNREYAYSLVLPQGYQGLRPDIPAPVHGFVVQLKGGADGTLSVNASYNTHEYSSLDEAANGVLKSYGDDVITVEKASTRMDRSRGFDIQRCTRSRTGLGGRRQTGVVAFRSRGSQRVAIVYSIVLDTPEKVHSAYLGGAG